jgi:methionyl-tRNA formyltransferase
MRTVYLGTSTFAVDVLGALATSPHRPSLVVTPPDRPRGRGRKVASPPVALAARDLGLDLHQAASVNDDDTVARIEQAAPEAICVCQFGQLVKEPLLSRYLMLNVHPSVLPRWRGAAPIERAIMAGDTVTGVTIFQITEGLDSGPIALVRHEPVRPDDTAGTLASRLAPIGAHLMVEALDQDEAGALEPTEQPKEGVTYADKIDPAERHLDPWRPAAELERIVRALTPSIGAYLELEEGSRLGVERAVVAADEATLALGELAGRDGRLLLGTGDGVLELVRVKPPGGRAMSASDYLRGHEAPARAVPPHTIAE